jgi:hypothetical protein
METQQTTNAREWRLGKEISDDLESIKYNFTSDYIKEILFKHANELDINIENIDELVNYYYDKGRPTGKKRTGFSNFFEFSKSKSREIYWLKRGWSKEQAEMKVDEYKYNRFNYKRRLLHSGCDEEVAEKTYRGSFVKGIKTLKSRSDYDKIKKSHGGSYLKYLKKINPETKQKYTEEEAKIAFSKKQSKAGKNSAKNKTKDKINTRIEHYLAKGLTTEEAQKALFERQLKNGLNYYISKYGLENGTKKYNKRIEEYGKKIKAHRKKHPVKWANSGKRYSDSSKRFFDSIINVLPELKKMKIYYADNEYFLWDKINKRIYFYDFYVKELNLIIEYHGLVWHPKERTQPGWKSIYMKESSEVVYDKDKYKEQLVINHGIDIIVIYEDEITVKKQQIINELHTRIKSHGNSK